MTDPIVHRVWDNLVTSLQAIDTTAGYHYTLDDDAIYQDMVNLMVVPKAPAVVIGPSEGSSRQFLPSMRVRERLVFSLEARVDATGLEGTRKGDAFAAFVADIEQALTADITRGGLACRTLLRAPIGPFMGFGNTQAVLFSQEIEIDLVRTYGVA